jgi:ArsR family transcriptional regulator
MMNSGLPVFNASAFNALAHPLRLKILEKLRAGPCCVCNIIPFVGGEQSNVSHHLAILRKAGIVRRKKKGQEMWYEVTNHKFFRIIDMMSACVIASLREGEALLKSLAEEER